MLRMMVDLLMVEWCLMILLEILATMGTRSMEPEMKTHHLLKKELRMWSWWIRRRSPNQQDIGHPDSSGCLMEA
jgi:hypothetical protein